MTVPTLTHSQQINPYRVSNYVASPSTYHVVNQFKSSGSTVDTSSGSLSVSFSDDSSSGSSASSAEDTPLGSAEHDPYYWNSQFQKLLQHTHYEALAGLAKDFVHVAQTYGRCVNVLSTN